MTEVRLTVGNVETSVLHDAETALSLKKTFPNAPPQD